ncbi:MAG: hypothetical protein LAO06_01055 [Acidobacteriia bacterium]|nr:hypothetical protein [Terriglobia bacterium]
MGVDTHALRLLCGSRAKGLSFSSTITIGRQGYHLLKASDLCSALSITAGDASALLEQKFIEPLLKRLGAIRIESLDYSAFEQATVVHDLNEPIPEALKASFSCVFDGGAIEHIFNFPQAIKNCMEMVAVGGHFLGVTAANNFMGHGFYQFSPELYYRVFSSDNGYAVEDMLLCETDRGAPWYRVEDPAALGRRVELINNRPTYIMVVARRLSDVGIFKITPQQSDYMSAWGLTKNPSASVSRRKRSAKSVVAKFLPRAIKKPLKRMITGRSEAFQSDAYRRV